MRLTEGVRIPDVGLSWPHIQFVSEAVSSRKLRMGHEADSQHDLVPWLETRGAVSFCLIHAFTVW